MCKCRNCINLNPTIVESHYTNEKGETITNKYIANCTLCNDKIDLDHKHTCVYFEQYNKYNTKFGNVVISEGELGSIKVTYTTDDKVILEVNSSNSITFHSVEPRTNIIKTMLNNKKLD